MQKLKLGQHMAKVRQIYFGVDNTQLLKNCLGVILFRNVAK